MIPLNKTINFKYSVTPMAIRLVAIDLDDTLLNPDRSISPVNRLTIIRTINAGVMVVLASGRTIHSMRPYTEELGMIGKKFPIICMNGAEIRDIDSKAIIQRHAFTPEQVKLCVNAVRSVGLPAQVYEDDCIIVTEKNEWTNKDTTLTGLPNRLQNYNGEFWAESRSKILTCGEPELLKKVMVELKSQLDGVAHLILSKPYFLELLPLGADKGTALSWVASKYGYKQEETMAIGDSWNDLGMLTWAAIGCAPNDANPEVLAQVRYVAKSNHYDGAVAELLKYFILDSK